jgi:hypothetical protein
VYKQQEKFIQELKDIRRERIQERQNQKNRIRSPQL